MRPNGFVAVVVAVLGVFEGSAHGARPSWTHASPTPPRPAPPPPSAASPPSATNAPTSASLSNAPSPTGAEGQLDFGDVDPSGVTAQQAGARAAATSHSAKLEEAKLEGATAILEQAKRQMIPRVTLTGRYTRLSDVGPTTLGPAGFNLIATTQPASQPGTGINTTAAFAQSFPIFPSVLDNYLTQAAVIVPVSDYWLRIGQTCSAATHATQAVQYDTAAARAKAAVEAKMAFYAWLRARGAVVVAALSVKDQRTHLEDVRFEFNAGNASRAEVLRAETAVAETDMALEHARNAAEIGELRVRVAMHAEDGERLVPGEGLTARTPPALGDAHGLATEALAERFELKSLEASLEAANDEVKAARSTRLPALNLFADAVYANPNARRLPLSPEWLATWDVGAQVTWSPNDAFGLQSESDAQSRASQLEALRGEARDAIRIEVTEALEATHESDVAGDTARRALASAEEARRVARQLFHGGRTTASMLADAETDLVRARLEALDAAVDARVARVQLDHALGRDTRLSSREDGR